MVYILIFFFVDFRASFFYTIITLNILTSFSYIYTMETTNSGQIKYIVIAL
jgi:hypothetical protein